MSRTPIVTTTNDPCKFKLTRLVYYRNNETLITVGIETRVITHTNQCAFLVTLDGYNTGGSFYIPLTT